MLQVQYLLSSIERERDSEFSFLLAKEQSRRLSMIFLGFSAAPLPHEFNPVSSGEGRRGRGGVYEGREESMKAKEQDIYIKM